jgi:hypothetical protein
LNIAIEIRKLIALRDMALRDAARCQHTAWCHSRRYRADWLKSRARANHIFHNRLTDELGGLSSYELEFPNGGRAYVVGNIIERSATTDNSTIISFGAEGYASPFNSLYLASNTIIDDRPSPKFEYAAPSCDRYHGSICSGENGPSGSDMTGGRTSRAFSEGFCGRFVSGFFWRPRCGAAEFCTRSPGWSPSVAGFTGVADKAISAWQRESPIKAIARQDFNTAPPPFK